MSPLNIVNHSLTAKQYDSMKQHSYIYFSCPHHSTGCTNMILPHFFQVQTSLRQQNYKDKTLYKTKNYRNLVLLAIIKKNILQVTESGRGEV